ncbi:hypothetical protein M0657_012301 [Pyricularia oryzae]|nr:hypothetical protein M0657_012301 [Pyricularia oryzae]KAI7911654.1 hypothetical protein M9X92_010429 [Pyricularia oryzae]
MSSPGTQSQILDQLQSVAGSNCARPSAPVDFASCNYLRDAEDLVRIIIFTVVNSGAWSIDWPVQIDDMDRSGRTAQNAGYRGGCRYDERRVFHDEVACGTIGPGGSSLMSLQVVDLRGIRQEGEKSKR